MPGIRTNAAAEVLGVSPNTLRSWERRYGFPKPRRTPGNHRNYELVELQTLRDALAETGNISSAIELTRQRQSAPASGGSLLVALESFDEDAAERAVEESLAVRPLERTVEELLLPAVDELAALPPRLRGPPACCCSIRATARMPRRCTRRRSIWPFGAPASAC
jgi:DNA-binding transcriptional MerR regulator